MAENKPLNLSVEPQGGATLGESDAPRAATGALLVDARKRKGLSVADVAGALRIRQVYLEAIEQGRLSDLPGATYALGFVRTYAEYLGLDSNEIVRRFKDEADELGRKTELVFPLPLSEGRFPGRIVILVSIALALFIYGVWHYTVSRDRSMVELVPPPPTASKGVTPPGDAKPAESQAPAQQPQAATAPSEPAKPAEPAASAPTASVSVPVPSTATPAPAPAPAASAPAQTPPAQSATNSPAAGTPVAASPAPAATPAKPSPSSPLSAPETSAPAASAPLTPNPPPTAVANPPPSSSGTLQANPPPPSVAAAGGSAPSAQAASSEAPKVFGDDSANVRIQLKAKAETWIQVTDENGKVIAMRTLKAGETYRVPNRNGLTLFTGNAGGLDVTVDGKKAPALGASGAVRRNVALEPDGLLAGE